MGRCAVEPSSLGVDPKWIRTLRGLPATASRLKPHPWMKWLLLLTSVLKNPDTMGKSRVVSPVTSESGVRGSPDATRLHRAMHGRTFWNFPVQLLPACNPTVRPSEVQSHDLPRKLPSRAPFRPWQNQNWCSGSPSPRSRPFASRVASFSTARNRFVGSINSFENHLRGQATRMVFGCAQRNFVTSGSISSEYARAGPYDSTEHCPARRSRGLHPHTASRTER